jgi:hypothetical protein
MTKDESHHRFDIQDPPTAEELGRDGRGTMPFTKVNDLLGGMAPTMPRPPTPAAPAFGNRPVQHAQAPQPQHPHEPLHARTVLVPPGAVPQLAATPFFAASAQPQMPARGAPLPLAETRVSQAPIPVMAAPAAVPVTPPPRHDSSAAFGGVAAASDAAVVALPRTAVEPTRTVAARPPSAEYLDLLWFDAAAADRIKRQADWRTLLRDAPISTEWVVGDEASSSRDGPRPERDVRRALARIDAVSSDGLPLLMADAVDEDGVLDRPICVIAGELLLSFDPLECLRIMIGAATHFAAADKKLKEVVDAASEVVAAEHPVPAALIEGLTMRLRQTFASVMRGVPPDALDSTAERALLAGRKYLRRTVLGGEHVCAEVYGDGAAPVSTYLPASLAETLPLFRRLRVRLLAEPHPPQDPSDAGSVVLKVLALARVVPRRRA